MRAHNLALSVAILVVAWPRFAVAQRLAQWNTTAPATVKLTGRWLATIPDSAPARQTLAGTGTVIGGVTGALVGAAAFVHFSYRNSSADNTTALVGVAIVGAGFFGSAGALLGRLVGSAIRR